MNLDDIRSQLVAIRKLAFDHEDEEAARALRDALWQGVLQAIADDAPDPAELAREALESRHII